MTRTTLQALLFDPPFGSSPHESIVGRVRTAAGLDLVASLTALDVSVTVVTPHANESIPAFLALDARVYHPESTQPFHFGDIVRGVIRRERPEGLLLFGSGSGVLLSFEEVRQLVGFARRAQPAALLNNFYSCDFASIAQPKIVATLPLPARDNPLGFALADAKIPCYMLPRRASTQFDIDTPTDLFVLRTSNGTPPRCRAVLEKWDQVHPTLGAVQRALTDRESSVHLVGRASPRTWADVERAIACRTSAFIEGRGMGAHPSRKDPLLAGVLRSEGPRAFFRRLGDAADAALIDSRPLLAGCGPIPPAGDRFASDMFAPERISDPTWRAFTEAAQAAPLPVILGGHCLVSGGLYVLSETCWKGRSLGRRLHPEPFQPEEESS